jgi:hypothetical protein
MTVPVHAGNEGSGGKMGTQAGNDPELTTAASLVVAEVIHDAGILDEYTTNNINPIIALKKIQLIIESEAVKKA